MPVIAVLAGRTGFEVPDTGGDSWIRDGHMLDIYMPDEKKCREWGRKNVYVKLIDAEG